MKNQSHHSGEKEIAIFPRYLWNGEQFGYSCGWYFKDNTGEYCWVFANFKTREAAVRAFTREKPDVKLINLDYEPPNRHKKPMQN